MRLLSPALLAVAIALGLPQSGAAQSGDLHPVLGKQAPRDVLNKDILALPQAERSAWVHGAVTQMSVVYASVNPDISGCLVSWSFKDGDGLTELIEFMKAYPDDPASAVIFAVAKRACPDL